MLKGTKNTLSYWPSLSISFLVLLPLLSLCWVATIQTGLDSTWLRWQELWRYSLADASLNTLILLSGVGLLSTILGVGTSWLVSAYDFPGKKIFSWALLLPLAVPTYIVAFVYLDLLHPIGPIQSILREWLGYDSPRQWRLPDLRGLTGAIFLLGFVLYPYIYLSTRALFIIQAGRLLEAAKTLGAGRFEVLSRVVLPLVRPGLVVGLSLVLLETLNDIGASEFLGVQTLTVMVYTTWVTRSDLSGAAQIALSMLFFVLLLIWLERQGRANLNYASHENRPLPAKRLQGGMAIIASMSCAIPILIGFVAPMAYLLNETLQRFILGHNVSHALLVSLGNTLLIAFSATLLTITLGGFVAWNAHRLSKMHKVNTKLLFFIRIANIGYAIPGSVLAIGLLTPFILADQFLGYLFDYSGLLIMGSIFSLILAYTIRFLVIAAGNIESGLERIAPSMGQTATLLGASRWHILSRIYLPLLRPALISATLLVFVDAMKELPATLLLRPIGFETLSTWLYAEASRGTYEEGALAALAIVLAGLLPVILLMRTQARD